MTSRCAGLLLLFLAATLPVPAPAQATQTRSRATSRCLAAIREAKTKGIDTGFMVVDADSGEHITSRGEDLLLVPASNMKVLSAGATLLSLGPAHEIYTDLIVHGLVQGGTLAGDVRLRGEGDPTLVSKGDDSAPRRLAQRVKARGIVRITGDLVVDDRIFKDGRVGPDWPMRDPTARYVAEVCGLALDHGTILITVRGAAKAGGRPSVTLQPSGNGVSVVIEATTVTGSKRAAAYAQRGPGPGQLVVRGQLPALKSQSFQIAAEDPSLLFGYVVAHELGRVGVALSGKVRRVRPDEMRGGGEVLLRFATPVSDILPVLLKQSQNHRAEMLFKHLGAARGHGGTFKGGASAVREAFKRAGADLGGVTLKDGSGLSRGNRLSARALVRALLALWKSKERDTWVDSLPHGGGDGTLKKRLREIGRRVHAKTGTLRKVSALSGYVTTAGGRKLAFAILNNGGGTSPMRRLQDQIVRALAAMDSR